MTMAPAGAKSQAVGVLLAKTAIMTPPMAIKMPAPKNDVWKASLHPKPPAEACRTNVDKMAEQIATVARAKAKNWRKLRHRTKTSGPAGFNATGFNGTRRKMIPPTVAASSASVNPRRTTAMNP